MVLTPSNTDLWINTYLSQVKDNVGDSRSSELLYLDYVFAPDNLWFGSDTYTNCALIYDLHLSRSLTDGMCHLYLDD